MKSNSKQHHSEAKGHDSQRFEMDSLVIGEINHLGTLNLDESSDEDALKMMSFLSEDKIPEREHNFQTVENTEVEI